MKTFGFGAKFAFDTIGLSSLTGASSAVANLSSQIDTAILANEGLVRSLGMIGVGTVGLAASKQIADAGKIAFDKAVDLEEQVVILRGKLNGLNDVQFNSLVRDLREVGTRTEYTDSQVVKAADSLRALGAAEGDILRLTKATLGFATASNSTPEIAASILQTARNALGGSVDMIDKYADAMMNAKNTTALASSEEGILEFKHLFKNIGAFKEMYSIQPEELLAYGALIRGAGSSAMDAGRKIKILGQSFSDLEFNKADDLKMLGVVMRDNDENLVSFNQVFEQLYEGYDRFTKLAGQKRADEIMSGILPKTAFGQFMQLKGLIKEMGGLEVWRDNIRNLSPELNENAVNKQWERVLSTARGKMNVISGALETTITSFGMPILEAFHPLLSAVGDAISAVALFVSDPKNKEVVDIVVKVAGAFTAILAVGSGLLLTLGITGLMIAALPILTTAFGVVAGAISASLPIFAVIAVVGATIYGCWNDISNLFGALFGYVKTNSAAFLWFGKLLLAVVIPPAKIILAIVGSITKFVLGLTRAIGESIWTFFEWANKTKVGNIIFKSLSVLIGMVLTPALVGLGTMGAIALSKLVAGFIASGVQATITGAKIVGKLVASMTLFIYETGKTIVASIATGTAFKGVSVSAIGASASVTKLKASLIATRSVLSSILAIGAAVIFVVDMLFFKQPEHMKKGTTGSNFWDSLFDVINAIADFLDFIPLRSTILGIAAAFVWSGRAIVNSINWIATAFTNSINWIVTAWDNSINWIVTAWNNVLRFFDNLGTAITDVFSGIGAGIANAFISAIDWIRDRFLSFLNWFVDKYNVIAKKLRMEEFSRFGVEQPQLSYAHSPIIPSSSRTPIIRESSPLNIAREVREPSTRISQNRDFTFNANIKVDGDVTPSQVDAISRRIKSDVYDSLRLAEEMI
jgi:TP901 family phage tail tape measure protein